MVLDRLKRIEKLFRFSFLLSLVGVLIFILDYGFNQSHWLQVVINILYALILILGLVSIYYRYFVIRSRPSVKVYIFDILSSLFVIGVLTLHLVYVIQFNFASFANDDLWINIALLITFIREFSDRNVKYASSVLNPAQLFILSFIGMILLGTLLLMLPNATENGISFVNALFTSTSAVCVTGLIVVDTGTYFTTFGQIIILLLIQMGGLGILTFASYFSYFFKGGTSYESQLSLREMTNEQKISEVFSTLKKILLITFTVELVGVILVFTAIDSTLFSSTLEHIFFAIFHSVSAFCNAGFSTFSNGLFESSVRFNYWLQLVIIGLFILGGLGFPILVNILKYIKYLITSRVLLFWKGEKKLRPWVLNINSRLTLITTFSLTIAGTVFFFISEYHGVLSDHNEFGKIVTSLFSAATPRTAGFNTIDVGSMHFHTTMIIILLMWVGASPASTGGGIKTSTFAIAIMNFIALAKGKSRIEVYRREIADISIRRAFAVISLSLVIIGLSVMLLSISDPEKKLLNIAFESFSAYSTVGLTLGVTSDLSSMGKVVIIFVMFIGRVSMLTILIAFFKKVKHKHYQYPTEEITIN